MTRVFEVMTRSLATCAPEAAVSDVAATMRDRNIGSVLVVRDGTLHGIVTDRDLATRALTGKDQPTDAPVQRYMSNPVVTGSAEWTLEHVSDVMAKHQIRRLPIVEDGQLTGIVSLGDVARHADKKQAVAKSLRAISEPAPVPIIMRLGISRLLGALAVAASATTVVAMLSANGARRSRRRSNGVKALYESARHRLNSARELVGAAVPPESMRQVRAVPGQLRTKLGDLSAQLATARR